MSASDIGQDGKTDRTRSAFVQAVIEQCRNKAGARQALRQALRKAYDAVPMTTHKYVVQAGAPAGVDDDQADRVRAYYTVAALIAQVPARVNLTQPGRDSQGFRANLGVCLAEAVRGGAMTLGSAEAALAIMGKQGVNGIHLHLPGIVGRVADRPDGQGVDWVQLLADLEAWPAHRSQITRRWQQSFYYTVNRTDLEAAQAADEQRPEGVDLASES